MILLLLLTQWSSANFLIFLERDLFIIILMHARSLQAFTLILLKQLSY